MKRLLSLALLLLTTTLHASEGYLFSLSLQNKIEDHLTQKLTNEFLIKLEDKIPLGIRYNFTEPLLVSFQDQDELSIYDSDNKALLLQKSIIDRLLNRELYSFNENGETALDEITKNISENLLKDQNIYDFSLKRSKAYNKRLWKCTEDGNYQLEGEAPPPQTEECKTILRVRERRWAYTRFIKKQKKLAFNTKMQIDPTSFGNQDLNRYNICSTNYTPTRLTKSGVPIKMLAMAVVYMDPGYRTSVLGHVAERYIFCKGTQLVDGLFEYTQLTKTESIGLKYNYNEYSLPDDYLRSLVGSIYMKRHLNPATSELYGVHQKDGNRNIVEIWLDLDEETLDEFYLRGNHYFKEQREKLKNNETLSDYKLLKLNCTHPLADKLNSLTDDEYHLRGINDFTPGFIFRFLKDKKHDRIILYPSQHLLRQMSLATMDKATIWDNFTFLSKTYDTDKNAGPVLIFPETHGFVKNAVIRPISGVVNLAGSIITAAYGIITIPIQWFTKKDQNLGTNVLIRSTKGLQFSLMEMVGFRARYPKPTVWSEAEKEYLYDYLPNKTPALIDLLGEKVKR